MKKGFVMLCVGGSLVASANLAPVKLDFNSKVPQTRWMYDSKSPIKPAYKKLAQVKQDALNGKLAQCSKVASEIAASFKAIQPWVLLTAATCEVELQKNSKKMSVGRARSLFAQISTKKDWLLTGPFSTDLRNILVELQLLVAEWEIKSRPQIASVSIGMLLDLQDWMSSSQKAKAYQIAGEHSFIQQNLVDAKAYILKSLEANDNPKLRDRLVAIESALSRSAPDITVFSLPAIISASVLGVEEQKIVDRMSLALKSGDLLSAAKDGMELIENYPGSVHADWAVQRIMDAFMSISTQDDEKYRALKYDFVSVMRDGDVKKLQNWGSKVFKAGFYKDALTLFKEAYSKASGVLFDVELLDYLARSYMYTSDFSKAEDIFTEITKKYSGTKESVDAYFYLGLINFNLKKFPKAQAHFERALAQTQYTEHELPARYWLWRASQKLDSDRAQQEAQLLINKFPFSYYGLTAIAEQNKGVIDLSSLNKPIKSKHEMWLSPNELESWKRAQILLESGWYEEASKELMELPLPNTPEGQALLGRYFAAAMDYPRALRMINRAWDEKSELRANTLIQTAFPKEFFDTIQPQAKQNKLDPILILSLIRQESSFNAKAVSASGALGLMQMIPPTAKEVAQALKIKDLELPYSMYIPEINIRMGSYYISKMIRDFQNNIPLGLAAYNAGPTKVKRWMVSSGLKPQSTSSPEYEIWIDMLPWAETRFYVKAILRNYLIYQLVDLKPVQVKNPVWLAGLSQPEG